MKYLISFILACSLLAGPVSLRPDRPKPVSLIQLIANPEKFDGKLVAVNGFLSLGEHPEFVGQQPILYMNQEDAKNLLLGNSVWVVPSDQMRRDQEKIDRMYVTLTGLFRAARTGTDSYEGGTITQVQTCTKWLDPNHPIGLAVVNGKYK